MPRIHEDDAKTLSAIEAELTKVANSYTDGAPSDRAESAALLFRQAELLVEKSRILVAHARFDEGQDLATHAMAILEGVAAVGGAQFRAKQAVLSISAMACKGLAQAQRDDWFAARHTLSQVTFIAAQSGTPLPADVAELEAAIASEEAARKKSFQQVISDGAISELLGEEWEDDERKLDRLLAEIASRVASARSIVGRVAQPSRFENWLLARLSYHLGAGEPESDDDDDHGLLHEDSGAETEAAERGKRLQLRVWSSKEMAYAEHFTRQPNEVVTDESLSASRAHGLLGLPHPDDPNRYAYPRWQFARDRREIIQSMVRQLKSLPEWSAWTFFQASSSVLQGLTPMQALGIAAPEYRVEPNDVRLAAVVKQYGTVERAAEAAVEFHLRGED